MVKSICANGRSVRPIRCPPLRFYEQCHSETGEFSFKTELLRKEKNMKTNYKWTISASLVFVGLVAVFALSSLASERVRSVSVPSNVLAEPQTKCERGFLHVQFQGQAGWFQTTKECDMRASPPKLDTSNSGARLTQTQIDALLESYLAGNAQPNGKIVCCCQPGWRTYDTSTHSCNWGKLSPKNPQ